MPAVAGPVDTNQEDPIAGLGIEITGSFAKLGQPAFHAVTASEEGV